MRGEACHATEEPVDGVITSMKSAQKCDCLHVLGDRRSQKLVSIRGRRTEVARSLPMGVSLSNAPCLLIACWPKITSTCFNELSLSIRARALSAQKGSGRALRFAGFGIVSYDVLA
jgi:hypothetical protein